jgi:colicin import membrane protein
MSNELVTFENINAVEVFKTGGVQPLIDRVREEVSGEVPDTSNDKGRKRIASLAHKVAKSKTALDKAGKELADQLNAQLKPINSERKLARDELDKLRDEIRSPLTDWESEQEAIETAELARVQAVELAKQKESDQEIAILLDNEFNREAAAVLAKQEADKIAYENQLKAEAVELAKAEALAETARIAAEYAEKERQSIQREADLKAEARQSEERVIRDKEFAMKREQAQIEQAKFDAENAEKRRLADIEAANRLNAERQQEEIERLALEQQARDNDKAHRTAVNRCAVSELMEWANLTQEQAKAVVTSIAKRKISKISISY